jgi:CubicO group peptidase (beta-lactamase class C family)
MRDTRWEYTDVPADRLALGYRPDGGGWKLEPLLHDGTYGAMGGLLTTMNDFAKYVSFHLAAWPARDDADTGVVRRASVREMQKPAEFTGLNPSAKNLAGEISPTVGAYGYGLGWSVNGQGVARVGHGGGLPGFGSYYVFYPNHGFGVIAFANLTYAGVGGATIKAGSILIEKARLGARTLPVSAVLETRKRQVADLLRRWEPALAEAIVAENFFLDRSREEWRTHAAEIIAKAGPITAVGELTPQNQLRGTISLFGEKGRVDVFFTLTPERNPRVQRVDLTFKAGK